jgi:hypothetical protein
MPEEQKPGDVKGEGSAKPETKVDDPIATLKAQNEKLEAELAEVRASSEKTLEELKEYEDLVLSDDYLRHIYDEGNPPDKPADKPVDKLADKDDQVRKALEPKIQEQAVKLAQLEALQQLHSFAAAHSDFRDLLPDLQKIANANPTWDINAVYKYVKMEQKEKELKAKEEDMKKPPAKRPTNSERHSKTGASKEPKKNWKEVFEEEWEKNREALEIDQY